MFDLKLNNKCNHRIINEKLTIKGTYPNYYAILKSPAIGNNHNIKIVDQNNLFEQKPKLINYQLNNDNYKYIYFNINDIDVDVRPEIYPKNSYYATYYTNSAHCNKCIMHSNYSNDIIFNIVGKLEIIDGKQFLVQKFKKNLITEKGKNIFNSEYGSELNKYIGKTKTALAVLMCQNTIKNTVNFIKNQQINYSEILDNNQKLLKIDDFKILPAEDERLIKFEFYLLSYADSELVGLTL